MTWRRFLLVAICGVCWGCAADGGPVGTGISTTAAISGNVVGVQAQSATADSGDSATTTLPIQVSIDGFPTLTTMADSSGNFLLSGAFAGAITLRFTVPQFQVTRQLDVPAGSTIVLQDIQLQAGGVVAQAARQLDFFGTVDMVDCAGGTLLIDEQRPNGMQFLVDFNDQTSFVDASGAAQSCGSVRVGGVVIVEGAIGSSAEQTITASQVTTGAAAPPTGPPPKLSARFSGAVAAMDCVGGFIIVDDSQQRSTVQVTAQTMLSDGSMSIVCQDLQLGDSVHGQGQITLRTPGVIVATEIIANGPPQPALRFDGLVTSIDCAGGVLELRDDETTIEVQLSSLTVVSGSDGQVLMCTDIQPDDHVDGFGAAVSGAPATLEATQVTVTGREIGDEAHMHDVPAAAQSELGLM